MLIVNIEWFSVTKVIKQTCDQLTNYLKDIITKSNLNNQCLLIKCNILIQFTTLAHSHFISLMILSKILITNAAKSFF